MSILREFNAWIEFFLANIPGQIGVVCRRQWFKRRLGAADLPYIGLGCVFENPEKIFLHGNVHIGNRAFFSADGTGSIELKDKTSLNINVCINASVGGRIRIGNACGIGPNVVLRNASHNYEDPSIPIQAQGHNLGDITIGDDVWIGANAVILGGVTIGKGVVIGAGAVVTRDLPAYSVAVGVPARSYRVRRKD